MANPHETSVAEKEHQSPEERFRELVLIRETEKRIEEKLDAAHAEAEAKLAQVKAQIQQMWEKAESETVREIQTQRQKASQEAETEAKQLVDQAAQIASGTESKASGNVHDLIEKFKEELLSK